MKSRVRFLTISAGVIVVVAALVSTASAISPGKNGRIAFSRFDPVTGVTLFYTANPDGSGALQVSAIGDMSPDHTRIAFDFSDADGNQQIATADVDGSNPHQLTSEPAIHEAPSWSPDGLHVAFDFSPVTPDNDPRNFHTTIYVMNSDGSDPHAVIPDTVLLGQERIFDVGPQFSPDGTQILFIRIVKEEGFGFQQQAVFIMNSDGSNVRQLTSWGLGAEHPSWSPDGQWIVFNALKEGLHPTGGSISIYLMRPDGSQQHIIYNGQSHRGGFNPVFSPEGDQIIFGCVQPATVGASDASESKAHDDDICVMHADGSNVVDVTNTPTVFENAPHWYALP
jgi:TolB protein